jgi:hypothetical protein
VAIDDFLRRLREEVCVTKLANIAGALVCDRIAVLKLGGLEEIEPQVDLGRFVQGLPARTQERE